MDSHSQEHADMNRHVRDNKKRKNRDERLKIK